MLLHYFSLPHGARLYMRGARDLHKGLYFLLKRDFSIRAVPVVTGHLQISASSRVTLLGIYAYSSRRVPGYEPSR
jgi:hypothetical protein